MSKMQHKVEIDGTEHEIELDTEALGVLTKDEVTAAYMPKETFESELSRRVKSATKGKHSIAEIVEDEEILGTVVKEHGTVLVGALKGAGILKDVDGDHSEALKRAQETWANTELKPVQEKLDAATTEIVSLRTAGLSSQVATAANETGVKRSMVPLIQSYYRDRTQWDDEYGGWFILDEGGKNFAYASKPETGKAPYKTVAEDIVEKRNSKEFGDWFDPKQRAGIGYEGGKPGAEGEISYEDFWKLDSKGRAKIYESNPDLYNRYMEQKGAEGEAAVVSSVF